MLEDPMAPGDPEIFTVCANPQDAPDETEIIEIDFKDGPSLTVGPGDVVQLQVGDQTTWNVKEPLRKFWVTP